MFVKLLYTICNKPQANYFSGSYQLAQDIGKHEFNQQLYCVVVCGHWPKPLGAELFCLMYWMQQFKMPVVNQWQTALNSSASQQLEELNWNPYCCTVWHPQHSCNIMKLMTETFKVSSGHNNFTFSCWLRHLDKKRATQDSKSVFLILPALQINHASFAQPIKHRLQYYFQILIL